MTRSLTDHPRLPKQTTRASLASWNWQAMFRGVFDLTCGGTTMLLVGFALALGVGKEDIGLITATVSMACIVQMVGLHAVGRVGDRKRFVIRTGLAEPLTVVAAVLALPLLPSDWRLAVLAVAVFASAAFLNMIRPITDDWVASIIPEGLRGRYIGRRFLVLAVTTIVTTLVVGQLAKQAQRQLGGGPQLVWALGSLLVLGGLFGVAAVVAMSRAAMPPMAAMSRVDLSDVPRTLRVRQFRRYTLGVLLYCGPFYFTVPYYQVIFQEELKLSFELISFLQAGYFAVRIGMLQVAGRLVDRLGPRRIVLLVTPLYVGFFALFVAARPGMTWPAFAAWALAGAGDPLYAIAVQVGLYRVIPATGARPAFFAVSSLLTLGLYAAGAVASRQMLVWLKPVTPLVVAGVEFGPFHVLFAFCTILMVIATAAAALLPGRADASFDHN